MLPTAERSKNRILEKLMSDGRKSFRTIAKELHMSTTTVSKLVKELEDENIIKGYHASVDWLKAGFDSAICLQITTLNTANIDVVGTKLKNVSSVQQVFYTTGDTTFSAYAVCITPEDAKITLETIYSIEGVERVVPHSILKMY